MVRNGLPIVRTEMHPTFSTFQPWEVECFLIRWESAWELASAYLTGRRSASSCGKRWMRRTCSFLGSPTGTALWPALRRCSWIATQECPPTQTHHMARYWTRTSYAGDSLPKHMPMVGLSHNVIGLTNGRCVWYFYHTELKLLATFYDLAFVQVTLRQQSNSRCNLSRTIIRVQ